MKPNLHCCPLRGYGNRVKTMRVREISANTTWLESGDGGKIASGDA
jgi:hypothetical protein